MYLSDDTLEFKKISSICTRSKLLGVAQLHNATFHGTLKQKGNCESISPEILLKGEMVVTRKQECATYRIRSKTAHCENVSPKKIL